MPGEIHMSTNITDNPEQNVPLTKPIHNFLIEQLREDPEYAVQYLNDSLQDNDPRMFLVALHDVIEAFAGNVNQIAKKTNCNRQNLYKVFKEGGNPEMKTILSVLDALNLGFTICPKGEFKPTETKARRRTRKTPAR